MIAAAALLLVVFLFGGGSRQHALRLALVELAALPLLVLAASRIWTTGIAKEHRFALGILAAVVALPIIQLIPLPASIWTALPGREQALLALSVAGIEPGWIPLSLTPDLTWRAFLALLPPVAMFLAMLTTSNEERLKLAYALMILTTVSLALGALQLLSGNERFYFWATTSAGNVTGPFANRNHLASLLVAMIPVAMLTAAAHMRRSPHQGRLALTLGALFVGLVVVVVAVIRSRAGIILVGPSLVLSLLATRAALGRQTFTPAVLGLAGVIIIALVLVAALGLGPVLTRFDTGGAPEMRFERWPQVAAAAQSYLPVGSGLGSFDAVYRSVEPLDQLDPTFFNQAHNDYLETWLETGWLGTGLIVVFFVWWGRRVWSAWRIRPSTFGDLKKAATIGLLIILAHSAGDYPLRTETLAVVFALLAGLLEARDSRQGQDDRTVGASIRRRVRR